MKPELDVKIIFIIQFYPIPKKILCKSNDYGKLRGSASGSIFNLINATPYEKPIYRKYASKLLESSGIFTPLEIKKYVDKKEFLNRSYNFNSAGIINRNKFDELKNFHQEK